MPFNPSNLNDYTETTPSTIPAREPAETTPKQQLNVWDKYKGVAFGVTALAFILYQMNVVPFNYFIASLAAVIILYLYSQMQEHGLFGKAISIKVPEVLDEAEKIRELFLDKPGWRLRFHSVHGANPHGARSHEPFTVYYRFRKWNDEYNAFVDWVIVKQSVLDKTNKNYGVLDVDVYTYKPIETRTLTWSGASKALTDYSPPTVISPIVERPVVRATPGEEGEEGEEYEGE